MTTLNNLDRALFYACSELGETMTLSADGTTVSTKKDFDRKTTVLSAVSIATAETHVVSVHPQISKITGRSRRFDIGGLIAPCQEPTGQLFLVGDTCGPAFILVEGSPCAAKGRQARRQEGLA